MTRSSCIACAAAIALLGAACGGGVLAVGGKAKPFKLRDTAGDEHSSAVSLSRASWVVLYGWSADCPASGASDVVMVALLERHAMDGVEMIAVDPDPADDVARIATAAGDRDLPFPILIDPGGKVARSFGLAAWPAAVLLDPAGILRWRGGIDGVEAALARAVAGEELPASTPPAGACELPR